MNSKHLLAIGGLAVGIATGMSAAPAGAVVLVPGSSIIFNDGAANTAGTVNVAAVGNSFTTSFNSSTGAVANVTAASGTFNTLFGGTGPEPVALTSSVFLRNNAPSSTVPGGIDYVNQSALTFNFGSIGTLTLPANSFFLANPAPGNPSTRTSFNIYNASTAPGAPNFFGDFTNGTDVSRVRFDSFEFTVDNASGTNFGNYALQVTAAPVPEPFTIIGTIVGGAAALRLRKKLSSSAKN
jgi:hypothetical protein